MSYSAPLAGRRFSPGTFTPAPAPNTVARIVSTLSWLEFRLFVRNGEQIVVNLVIPVAALLILTLVPIGELGTHRATVVVPAVMAAAIVSSAFTGQSIAVGFDRRYGALKCVGSTIAPLWAIVVAKSVAVVLVVAGQLVLLGVLGVFLGWAPNSMSLFEFGICAVLGTACFAAMGLLLGGSTRAEIVLPLANIAWLVQLAICYLAISSRPSGPLGVAVDY